MERRVWSPSELEELTPAQQDALFEASLVKDLNDVPESFLATVRERVERRISEANASKAR
jgi:hypothetical protein